MLSITYISHHIDGNSVNGCTESGKNKIFRCSMDRVMKNFVQMTFPLQWFYFGPVKVNSLAQRRYSSNFESIIFKLISLNIMFLKLLPYRLCSFGTHCEIAARWVQQNRTNEKSTLPRENGLVKAIPEPMLVKTSDAIWRHCVTMD